MFGGGQTISTSDERVGALRIQSSTYGGVVPIVFGTNRITPNLLWYGDFTPIAHTETQSAGGKGMEGPTQEHTSYTYTTAFMLGLAEGAVYNVLRAWANKDVYGSYTDLALGLYAGGYTQGVWPHLSANHPEAALAYRGHAYLAASAFDLGGSPSLPNFSFEVQGTQLSLGYALAGGAACIDANPAACILDTMSNAYWGAGFPIAYRDSMTDLWNYCISMGLFISPAMTEQRQASEWVSEWAMIANSAPIWSEGKLKIIPFADSASTLNGVTYTPNTTPIYDLTDNDFLEDVRVIRKSAGDVFNQVQVEYLNRANDYNVDIAEAKDQADIELNGLRPKDVLRLHAITDVNVANLVAQLILQRSLYVRTEYQFSLGWKYCLLEPMDLVTITVPSIGLNQQPVRIIEIGENEDGKIDVRAEIFPKGAASATLYPVQSSLGYSANYNYAAGNVNEPLIFEPPDRLASGLQVWLAVSGSSNWGGCHVWVSYSDETYKKVGTVTSPARHGTLTASLVSAPARDTSNILSVKLFGGQLLSGTTDDAENYRTICYVGGELVSYRDAALTAPLTYNLSYLRRGVDGTAISGHVAGEKFARLDDAIFKLPFAIEDLGRTIKIKFQSFNQLGGGLQDISTLSVYSYALRGGALSSPLPNVQNVTTNFVSGVTNIYWDAVDDFRSPIDYEVRIGSTFNSGQTVGRTPLTKIPAIGDGTYWIAAHYYTPNSGVDVYSVSPTSIVISGAVLTRNVLATYQQAPSWSGTKTNLDVVTNTIRLANIGDYLGSANILAEPNIISMGGIATSGTYQIPTANRVNVGRPVACNIILNLTSYGESYTQNVLSHQDYLNVLDILDFGLGQSITVQPQIRIAQADGVYSAWINYVPGEYVAQYFDARVNLATIDQNINAVVSAFAFTVDVPDRIDKGTNVAIATTGTTFTFATPFNAVPNVQITILSASAGDDAIVTGQTASGFTVQVLNAGAGAARNINWIAQGY